MRVKSQLREGSFREEGGVYMYSCQQKKIKTYKTMPTPQQINQTIHRPTNQNEYNLLIKSIPFSLVEIYASWCGPSRIFKVDALNLSSEECQYIQLEHGLVQKYTSSGSLSNRKNNCQPTFLLLDKSGKLLHLQHGIVVSELRRVIRENINKATTSYDWQSNTSSEQEHQQEQHQQEHIQQQTEETMQPAGSRRSSMKVDSSELRRRNSMASTGLKNKFNTTKQKNVVPKTTTTKGSGESTKNFNTTMQGLNSII